LIVTKAEQILPFLASEVLYLVLAICIALPCKIQHWTRGALHSKTGRDATGRVSCVCDWLRYATGLDFGDRSWICNAAYVRVC